MSDGTIDKLREAMAEFDGADRHRYGGRTQAAQRVLRLVRELLSEVDGVRAAGGSQYHIDVEPLGGPVPGVDGSHLPDGPWDYLPGGGMIRYGDDNGDD